MHFLVLLFQQIWVSNSGNKKRPTQAPQLYDDNCEYVYTVRWLTKCNVRFPLSFMIPLGKSEGSVTSNLHASIREF